MPLRLDAASSSRRANPLSKSRAIPKPVKTPANAADWTSDERELERRVAGREARSPGVREIPDRPAREGGEEEQREDE